MIVMVELLRLLDNGWNVQLFRNGLGTYTAEARSRWLKTVYPSDSVDTALSSELIADGPDPETAVVRLLEKVLP